LNEVRTGEREGGREGNASDDFVHSMDSDVICLCSDAIPRHCSTCITAFYIVFKTMPLLYGTLSGLCDSAVSD
jgi:hypothetical protein